MNSSWLLGNDVVDLTDPRCCGRSNQDRFLARVFDPLEAEQIRRDPDPERALWVRWAGKEAAFKSVSKALGAPPPFLHPLFRIEIHPGKPGLPFLEGVARYEGYSLSLRVEIIPGAIHVLSWRGAAEGPPPNLRTGVASVPLLEADWRTALRPRFSSREWDCVSHVDSALTRLTARRALAGAIGINETRIEVGCRPGTPGRRIPFVLVDGRETPVDLSLSHHGAFQAWAFLTPLEGLGLDGATGFGGPVRMRS